MQSLAIVLATHKIYPNLEDCFWDFHKQICSYLDCYFWDFQLHINTNLTMALSMTTISVPYLDNYF